MKTYIMRTLLVFVTFFFAVSIPKFGLFVNLIGAMSGTVLAFVMPIYIYNKAFEDEMTKTLRFWHTVLVAFGICVGTIASTMSLYELIEAFSEEQTLNDVNNIPTTNSTIPMLVVNETIKNF